ncbi:hypothetical protein [Aphanothece sacrum]|uniref:General secretion pathway protein D n=1 Tax=Aphanothece sacrum FPU1 TaxID=1920663 RepID=A0A401IN89_APHSA|nr:hypothetical protein [Aphanothece sacrum]GBF82696.1 general secretion pathway protein D [Aphanothece sacrum FPU1]GBF84512.1 general secretion pathway protein D [Aphanothece sacrum FPU3]
MKLDKLKQRLHQDRPTVTINLQIPEDVLKDLQEIAPKLGFSNYQALIRAYIGQGLRVDWEKLENNALSSLIESLRKHGVTDDIISAAIADIKQF